MLLTLENNVVYFLLSKDRGKQPAVGLMKHFVLQRFAKQSITAQTHRD